MQDFLEDLQSISGRVTSLGSKAQKVVTAPVSAVSSIKGKLTQGSLNKPLSSSTEQRQIERTAEVAEQKQEQKQEQKKEQKKEQKQDSENSVATSGGEKTVVENSA